MQTNGAYVDQIPASAKPPAVYARPGGASKAGPPPPGLYVRIADARSQAEAIRTSLALAERLGPSRPPFMRGEMIQAADGSHIAMFAGPFDGIEAAKAFCVTALPTGPCLARTFGRR